MKKFFTFIAMALVTMGASAQTTVWEYDYAKLATDHVTYQGKIDVVRITDTKYKACGTDVYPFTCGEVVAASDVMISRGDGMLRYSDVRNLGLFNNNKTIMASRTSRLEMSLRSLTMVAVMVMER